MEGKKLAKCLLLMMVLDLLLFSSTQGSPWWRRRRRRSPPRCSSHRPSRVAWVNTWHKSFTKTCPTSQSVRFWFSQHRNCKKDRIHYFRCGYAPMNYREHHCTWSYYVNDYDEPLTFKCHHNGFIAGVRSSFSGKTRDRRFSFRCCHESSYIQHHCKTTPYLNDWDQEVRYTVPLGYYLVGAYSYHSNHHEDRLWRFEICKISRSRWGKR